jgi:Domain of unknown function (DUF4386)
VTTTGLGTPESPGPVGAGTATRPLDGERSIDPFDGASPRRLARTAGVLYLINIVGGAFAIGFVDAKLFVADAATTVENIQANELLYRSALAAHIVVTLTNVPLAVIFYELFKVVSRRLALLDAFFILVATAIEAAGLLHQFTPLLLLGSGASPTSLTAPQVQALTSLSGDLSDVNYALHTAFFGFDILCTAYLVLRSRFLPRAIGILLAIDGAAYLIYTFADVLTPAFAADLVPWIQLPALLGEGAFCLWLLVVGIDVTRWQAASAAARGRW